MLNYNQIRDRAYIVLDGDPYEVLEFQISRKQAQKPVNQTKLRNLLTGNVKQHTFHTSDTVKEADIEKSKITYSFQKFNRQNKEMEYWFYKDGNKGDRFQLEESLVGDKIKFIKENSDVDALLFNDQIIGISLPMKVNLKVTEAAPAVKGNTATGATKSVKLETGLEVFTPLFINEGDIITIKTENNEYVERAK